mgnify:CR=1 FL=1|jgi:hypothetical protein
MKLVVEIPEQTSQKIEKMGMSTEELTDMFLHWIQRYLNALPALELEAPPKSSPSLLSVLGTGRGGFATPAEADAFIRAERDAWNS